MEGVRLMPEHDENEWLHALLGQVCKRHHGRVRASFEGLGLYRGQSRVLRVLWEQEGLTHSELARSVHVKPATVTKTVQRMEHAGFLERRPDPRDQRMSRVYLTERGREVQDEVQRVWKQIESETFDGFTLAERALLRRFFLQLRDNLDRVSDDKLDHR